MKDTLLLSVRKFLEQRIIPDKPILIGCSGGPDSKALLYLLFKCQSFFPYQLQIAHIDHGWRDESKEEAESLQKEAENLRIPFFLRTFSKKDFTSGNLEEQARNFRLQFFSQLYTQNGCQALVLGHHADDQAEVILKRVFEGSSLFSLSGLEFDRSIEGMKVWRPLLGVQKKTVLDWLKKQNLTFFTDPTNHSSSNLRGKMRKEILPFLNESFGKDIASNLCSLAGECQELREHFSALNQPILMQIKKEGENFCLDLNPFLPLSAMQLKYLLKELMGKQEIAVSRQIIEGIIEALQEGSLGKKFMTGKSKFQIERGFLYFSEN